MSTRGGGGLLRPEAGLSWRALPDFRFDVLAGYTWAWDGDLSAPGITLSAAWDPEAWEGLAPLAQLPGRADPWRIAVGNTWYATKGKDPALMDVLVEKPMTRVLSLLGHARSAWSDQAGGYSEGLLGLRLRQRVLSWWELGVAGEIGAGGGGGMPTGDGLIAAWTVDSTHWLSDQWGLRVALGATEALRGVLQASSLTASLIWRGQRLLVE